jgi:hypothetical protein
MRSSFCQASPSEGSCPHLCPFRTSSTSLSAVEVLSPRAPIPWKSWRTRKLLQRTNRRMDRRLVDVWRQGDFLRKGDCMYLESICNSITVFPSVNGFVGRCLDTEINFSFSVEHRHVQTFLSHGLCICAIGAVYFFCPFQYRCVVSCVAHLPCTLSPMRLFAKRGFYYIDNSFTSTRGRVWINLTL